MSCFNSLHSERIVFEECMNTFFLYPGNSLYSFCINPELSLEHLYWGERLNPGYDLRYLRQANRRNPFEVSEVRPVENNSFQKLQNAPTDELIKVKYVSSDILL